MPSLNVREVPEELYDRLKPVVHRSGKTMKKWILEAIAEKLYRDRDRAVWRSTRKGTRKV